MITDIVLKIKLKLAEIDKVFKDVKPENFTFPPNVEMGDLSLPVFDLAKENPAEFAAKISEKLESNEVWEKVEAKGPYLNFYLKAEVWAKEIIEARNSKSEIRKIKKEKVMIEYSQPNTHKEFHVGHLRNACIGSALVNLYKYSGNKVIAANYMGDTGTHVSKCLWALQKFHKDEEPKDNKANFLGKVYSEAVQKTESDPELEKEVSEISQKLETGDKEIKKLWKKTRQWSLDEFERIYKLLGVDFDVFYFESDMEKEGKKMLSKLLENKYIKEDQGAVIADLKEFDLDVLVLIKSDGAALYGIKDIPLAYKKVKKYKPDKMVYVIDVRQKLYLQQIFKILDLLGLKQEKIHVMYDFVNLKEGAMASRKGNVVSFDEFYKKMLDKSIIETKKRHKDWDDEKLNQVAEKISLAAMKVGMLKFGNNKVITFDMDEALSFDGKTGPYLLYTAARINSIKEKVKKVGDADYSLLREVEEKELLKLLANNENEIERAYRENDPSVLCNYLFDLAQNFNDFYQKHSIIRAENEKLKAARFNLAQKVGEKLRLGLDLLNVEWLEKM